MENDKKQPEIREISPLRDLKELAQSKDLQELREKTKDITENLTDQAIKTIERGVKKTRALKFHVFILIARATIFVTTLVLYVLHRDIFNQIITHFVWNRVTILHVLWVIFMAIMIFHLLPNNRLTMAIRRAKEEAFCPVPNYKEIHVLKYTQSANIKAWKVMLVWLSFNAIFGILYLLGVITEADLLMLTVFYYLSDYICIMLFCPFQTFIMGNKCCINCRIYDWGHFMMFTPMLFIKNFYSWSLFFTSLVVLIHWEVQYAGHPERFWEGSNASLQCENCTEKICQVKKKLAGKL